MVSGTMFLTPVNGRLVAGLVRVSFRRMNSNRIMNSNRMTRLVF